MFQLKKTVISEDIIEKDFVCNLNACKGECCIAGEAGAPLESEEAQLLKDIYPEVKPYLRPEGIQAIEQQGTHITTPLNDLETPLVNGKEMMKDMPVAVLKMPIMLKKYPLKNLFPVICILFVFKSTAHFRR